MPTRTVTLPKHVSQWRIDEAMEILRDFLGMPLARRFRFRWRHHMMPGMIDPCEWAKDPYYRNLYKEWEDYD